MRVVRDGDAHAHVVALFFLIALCSFIWPSSMFSLVKSSFVEPTFGVTTRWRVIAHVEGQGSKSKRVDMNVRVLLDSASISWIGHLLCHLKRCHPMDAAWNFRYPQFLHVFEACAACPGEPGSPRCPRRSGASADRADGARSVEEVWKRGQWTSKSSLDVHGKAPRLASELSLYSPAVVTFMRHAHVRAREVGFVTAVFVAVLETKRSVLGRSLFALGLPCQWWSLMPQHQQSCTDSKERMFLSRVVETGLCSAVIIVPTASHRQLWSMRVDWLAHSRGRAHTTGIPWIICQKASFPFVWCPVQRRNWYSSYGCGGNARMCVGGRSLQTVLAYHAGK